MTRRVNPGFETALAGRRVIELADETGAYCGKLLADMGADVIKVERPGGDAARMIPPFWNGESGPDRSLSFLFANTNKRSVELDLEPEAGRAQFARLAVSADLVIETCPPGTLDAWGIGFAALSASNPALVFTSITGFGQTGPQRAFRSSDIVASAVGGAMYVTGEEEDPPVKLAGSQATLCASTNAAASSMIALHRAARSGRGQHVDISLEETFAAVASITGVGKWLEDGIIPKRVGTGLSASCPSGAFPCKDGRIYLMVNRPLHWKAVAAWIHEVTKNEEVLDPMFDGPSSSRLPYRELLDLFITDLTSQFTVEEIYHEGQRRHIAVAPVNTAASAVADVHLVARDFFVNVEHPGAGTLRYPGAPFRHTLTPWRIERPAPQAGEHSDEVLAALREEPKPAPPARTPVHARESPDPKHALGGLRVVEFSAGLAGPWIGRFMAWCGAEVIKVESRDFPDVTRLYVPPRTAELGIQPQLSPWFTDWNAGKKFVSLDLTNPEGADLARKLVAESDVVIENYSTGVLEKFGLGYEDLARIKASLVMFGTTGYGNEGPNRQYVSWGPNIEALAGMANLTGFPERDCTMSQFAYPDPLTALHGLFAVMCALDYRDRTGKGQYINLCQFELTVSAVGELMMEYLANGQEPEKLGNRSRHRAPQGCYRCRGDDRWIAISVSDDSAWERLCKLLGRAEWIDDPRFSTSEGRFEHGEELDREIGRYTAERVDYDVMAELQAEGIAAGVVQNTEDQLHRDPQLAARRYFERIPHNVKGEVTACGIPLGLTGTPGSTPHAGEARGQENEYVFRELLGLGKAEYDRLVGRGAIETFDDDR